MPKNVIKDFKLLVSFGLAFFTLFLGAVFAYSHFADFAGSIIIHFEAGKGVDFLGSARDLFGILFSAVVMTVVNLFLSDFLYYRERFLAYVYAFVSLTIAILILIIVGVIISVN